MGYAALNAPVFGLFIPSVAEEPALSEVEGDLQFHSDRTEMRTAIVQGSSPRNINLGNTAPGVTIDALDRQIRHKANAMEKLLQDIRYGTRSLVNAPRFTVAAVLTLALGMGANTAMFSVIQSVLLKPWPFQNPGRLLYVSQRQADGNGNLFSTRDFLDWKQQGGLLAKMAADVPWQFNLNSIGAQPERVPGGEVSYDLLPVLGIQPSLGRVFSAQEDVAGSGNFVLLSSVLWKGRYGADPNIVGKSIQLDGAPYTVVGIMPAGFHGFDGKELLWTPLQLRRDSGVGASANIHWLVALSACRME